MPLTTLASRPVRRPKVVIAPPADNWTLRVDTAFDTTSPSGWTSIPGYEAPTVVSGGVAMTYETGQGGNSPWAYEESVTRSRGVRSVQWVHMSSDWKQLNQITKDIFWWGGPGSEQIPMCVTGFSAESDPDDPLHMRFGLQAATGVSGARTVVVGTETEAVPEEGNYIWDNYSVEFTRNAIHEVDTRIIGNSAAGLTDGSIEVLLDDVIVIYVTGLCFRAADAVTFDLCQWSPTYGGLSPVPSPGGFQMRTGDGAGNGIKLYTMD